MNRKDFFLKTGLFGAASLVSGSTAIGQQKERNNTIFDLSDIPIFCGHEHWGSIFSIGQSPAGFNADVKPGALPIRKTTLVDIIMDPYFSGIMNGVGISPLQFPEANNRIDIFKKAAYSPVEAYQLVSKSLKDFQLKGTYQCLRLAMDFTYGFNLSEQNQEEIRNVNFQITKNYSNMFSWYRKVMKKANLVELIRPVQPEFYFADYNTEAAIEELSFTSTLLRIDKFLDFWKELDTRRDTLSNILGVDPVDANSWREFLDKLFIHAATKGCIGIKQLQAYYRSLNFKSVNDNEVVFRGNLSDTEVTVFQDWVMHECCRLANIRKWPHQIHVGTHNLTQSNPLPLEKLARMYPDQKIVMLHCWPFIKEAGFLAQSFPNIYIDTCWQQVLNPEFLKQSLETWLGYIPINKITMSNDSTSVEMAVGSSFITRQVVTGALSKQKEFTNINEKGMMEIATSLMYNNSVEIYGIGKKIFI